MPCARCDTPLLVSHKYENLRCPNCSNIGITPHSKIKEEVEQTRELLGEDEVIGLLKNYKKNQVILAFLRMANKAVNQVWETRGVKLREFSTIPQFIKLLLPESGFGDEELNLDDWPPEVLDTVLDHRFRVSQALTDLEERFQYGYPNHVVTGGNTVLARHSLMSSEFYYCFIRNLESLVGGREVNRDLFDRADLELRDFDTPSGDEIQSVRDFAETFYEGIIGLSFFMSSQEAVGNAFYNEFPESTTIRKIGDLLDRLEQQFPEDTFQVLSEEGELGSPDWSELEQIGLDVFGEDWPEVRQNILMTPENTDAHPFLFGMVVNEPVSSSGVGSTLSVNLPHVFFARDYTRFVRFQMFPLLYDEDGNTGHSVLESVTYDRSTTYERNVHEYLLDQGFESYHSLKYHKSNEHELDILAIPPDRNEVWCIDCKYKMPGLQMNTEDGIRSFNDKMTESVFDDGEPLDKKIQWWMENMPGDRFTTQVGPSDEDRVAREFKEHWGDKTVRKFVVSNLVPSYPSKRGVVFLTGLEFMEFVEEGEFPYQAKHDYLVE